MAEVTLKLAIRDIITAEQFFHFYWDLKGPPNEWYQVWMRTAAEDEEFGFREDWKVHKEGNFDGAGNATGIVMLIRATHTGHKVELMAIGENDVFSNHVKIPSLTPPPDAPEEKPMLPYQCYYCKQRFETLGELKEHQETCPEYQKQFEDVKDEVSKIAEATTYESSITATAAHAGTTVAEIERALRTRVPDRFSTLRLGAGKTPQSVYENCLIDAKIAEAKYNVMVGTAVIAESAPWLDIGLAMMQAMSAPKWGAGTRMATDFYYSGFRYATDPMIQRYQFELHTPLLPEAYRLALAASKGILTDKVYKKAMAQSGLSKEWADMWVKQNYLYPDFGQITNMYWRKLLDKKTYEPLMRLAGYRKEDIANLKKLTEIIPPLTDIITMAVREAFGKHTYEEQKPALLEWGAKQGLSAAWVERYWYSHWDRIPLTQMYSNLWRGHWDDEAFDRMLRIKDVHPDDREAILRVAYLPPGIREMGYGYDFGRYTREDIVRYRRMGGLTKEDAGKAADSLIDFRTAAEWEAIRREFLWMFAHEEITEEEYKAFLDWTGLQPNIIELWLWRGLLQKERFRVPETAIEYRIVTSSEALWAFKNNLKNEKWLRGTLSNLGWAEERVELAVERALYQKAMAEDIPDIITPRTLTIAQLKSLYNAQLISIEALTERLQLELHYTREDAIMLARTFVKPPVEPEPELVPRKLTLSLLKQMYEAQIIDSAQLIVELVESLNYDINDAYAIAYLWTPKVEPEVVVPEEAVIFTKPYSDSWSRRLYAQRLLMDSEVYKNYIALGYPPKKAEKLTISLLIDDMYPMLTAQYKKGLINEVQFLTELVYIGMHPWQAIELLERTIRDFQVDRLDDERKLTKSEILKGLKSRVLTIPQTAELLTDIGYEYWEAQYIINLELIKLAGDPETYWEMKKVTEAYKRALNRDNKPIPEEVLMLDKQIRKIKQEIELLEETGLDESKMAEKKVELGDAEARLRKVIVLKKL